MLDWRSDEGSMPLAALVTMFLLFLSTLGLSTLASQVASDRLETADPQAVAASSSGLAAAAQSLSTLGSIACPVFAGVPISRPDSYTAAPDGAGRVRWWLDRSRAADGVVKAVSEGVSGNREAPATRLSSATFQWDSASSTWDAQNRKGNDGTAYAATSGALRTCGSLDTSYKPMTLGGSITSLVAYGDKLIIGGNIPNAGGDAATDYVARANADGSRDTTFRPAELNATIRTVVLQPDGKILIGGQFSNAGYPYLARLNADGSRDTTFTPAAPPGIVWRILLQSDGKVVAGGDFGLIRVGPSGEADPTFTPPTFSSTVIALSQLSDGKLMVGGAFANLGGNLATDYLARLNTDGTRDTSYTPPVINSNVRTLVQTPDGKLLVGGNFQNLGGNSAADFIARLDQNQQSDPTFQPEPGDTNVVYAIGQSSDGKIYIGGNTADTTKASLSRLEANGARDKLFTAPAFTITGTTASVAAVLVRSDDSVFVGGSFSNVNGTTITRLALLR